jgi:two-component system nitrogen regulation response regulator GlnG
MGSRVLVVEDDAAVSASIQAVLSALGHDVCAVPSAELALEEARDEPPHLVLLDVNLPGRSGLDVLPELLGFVPSPAVIVITADPTAENAIDAMARGAVAHLAKPLDIAELERTVAAALREVAPREAPAADGTPRLVGSSRAMLELGRRVGALARSDATVLVLGESGTGKELVARAIHERSARGDAPFVAVSCAALPDTLIEAELFGHEKGAFTGATETRGGRVERAEGGTLFLDEVGELTPAAQTKLLRFLEERTFERVGGDATRKANVRIVAATNASLEEHVANGIGFRRDLYFRLNVARVVLPTLRERREDIPQLVDHFLTRLGRPEVQVSPEAMSRLAAGSWPGNVRELRNAVEAALVALGPTSELRPEHVPAGAGAGAVESAPLVKAVRAIVEEAAQGDPPSGLYAQLRAQVERAAIETALETTGGNQVAATRLLGMNRATLRRKMAEFGLNS